MAYFILIIPILLLSLFVQWRFKHKFNTYAHMPLSSGLTGAQVAAKMLHDSGVNNVKITSTEGSLTDHYNPKNYTVNLSTDVAASQSVAAAAVAAHECGHALQHAAAYSWLNLRSILAPAVSITSNLLQWVILLGLMLLSFTGNPILLSIGVAGLLVITVFSFVTLPVEFDATKRALAWLQQSGIMHSQEEYDSAKDALKWASYTYVVAAMGALGNLLYYAGMLFSGRRSN